MHSFALFRLPFRQKCTLMLQKAHSASSSGIGSLDTSAGFVIAPFDTASLPTLIVKPDVVKHFSSSAIPRHLSDTLSSCCHRNSTPDPVYSPTREDYSADFAKFHQRLLDNDFYKLVLARKAVDPRDTAVSPTELFSRACQFYPRLFIALFSAPQCGTWLVATPELLVNRNGNRCHTMSLAGTMAYQGDSHPEWNKKNIDEQQFVTSYILDMISPFTKNITVNGPHTVRAGELLHLRSQITFTDDTGAPSSAIIGALHPTPAVCGLPKQPAMRFILDNEYSPRDYYSGFCGPSDSNGITRLFVSLRCMRLCHNSYELFAGGGILKASTEESEWNETESKMSTMRRIIRNS